MELIPQGQLVPHWLMMRDGRLMPLVRKIWSESSGPEDYLERVYKLITTRVKYVPDKKEFGMEEYVQMPYMTLVRGAGDCEDSAMTMVSMAAAMGIPARMGLGYLSNGGSHRWAEAMYDGEWHVFETTNGKIGHFPTSKYKEMGYHPVFYVAPNFFIPANALLPPVVFP